MSEELRAQIRRYLPAVVGVTVLVVALSELMFALGRESAQNQVQPEVTLANNASYARYSPPVTIPDDPTCKDFSDAYEDETQKAAYITYINQQFAQRRAEIIIAKRIVPPQLFVTPEMLQNWYEKCIASPDMKVSVPIDVTFGFYVTNQCGMGGC